MRLLVDMQIAFLVPELMTETNRLFFLSVHVARKNLITHHAMLLFPPTCKPNVERFRNIFWVLLNSRRKLLNTRQKLL